MNKVKFDRKFLRDDLELPYSATENNIIDSSRWSIQHKIVFAYEDKFYQAYYSKGATEMQDESPWEYEEEVECIEVELKEVKVMQWVTV